MKNKNTVDEKLDVLLSEMPIEVSADFSDRIFDALIDEEIGARLTDVCVEPSADFTDRVMAEIAPAENNVVTFPRRREFLRISFGVAAGVAAVCVACFGMFAPKEQNLRELVAQAVESDPELVALVTPEEETYSLDDLLAASQLLTVLNEYSTETAEIFAYYE